MALAKLGPHVLSPTTAALAWLRTANIVKVVDRAELLRQCRPAAVMVYRKYFSVQDLSRHGANVAGEVLADCRAAGVVPTYIELYNECGQDQGDRLLQLAAEAQPMAEQYGSRVLALSGGTGWWEREDWQRWQAADFYGVRHFALHEYWGAFGFSGWNACRYERVLEWTRDSRLRFVVTECGRDRVEGGLGGWQADGIPADQYRAELERYDRRLRDCPQMVGGVAFTAGAGEGTWQPFDTDPLGTMETEPAQLETGGEEMSTDYAGATWWPAEGYGYPPGTHGRNDQPIVAIVDHIAQGSRAGMRAVLAAARVGWHYSVYQDGTIEQHIAEEDAAWAAGLDFSLGYDAYRSDVNTPWIAACWRERVSPNLRVINIEHEGLSGQPLPPAQIAASRELHRDLSRRLGLPLDREHVVGHYRLDARNRPNDPGPTFPWGEILAPAVDYQALRDAAEPCLHQLWALSELTHRGVIAIKEDLRWPGQ